MNLHRKIKVLEKSKIMHKSRLTAFNIFQNKIDFKNTDDRKPGFISIFISFYFFSSRLF